MLRTVGKFLALGWIACVNGPLAAQPVLAQQVVEDVEADVEGQPDDPNEQVFGPEVLDQWLFQNGNEQQTRKNLESQLTLRTADVDRVCQLTEPQRKKLLLAGRSEIKRLFDEVDERRRKFQHERRDQRRVNQLWQEIQPLRMALMGTHFGDASLFDKVVRKTMSAEQLPRYLRHVESRRQFRRQAQLEMILLSLDKEVPLRAEQREQFLALLQELPSVRPGQFEPYALMYAVSQLPEERFRPILDDGQWKSLQSRFEQSRNMGQWLKQSGALSAEDPLEE